MGTTAGFCRNVLELAASNRSAAVAKVVNPKKIRQVLKQCDKMNTDAKPIDFNESKAFTICARSFTPIYTASDPIAKCPFSGSEYHKKFEGTMCDNSQMCIIGTVATGLRCYAE